MNEIRIVQGSFPVCVMAFVERYPNRFDIRQPHKSSWSFEGTRSVRLENREKGEGLSSYTPSGLVTQAIKRGNLVSREVLCLKFPNPDICMLFPIFLVY